MPIPAPRGDVDELATFMPQLRARARNLIGPKLRPLVGSSDLLQETLLAAVRDFAALSGRPGREILAWLNQAMMYRLLRNLRKHRRELEGERAIAPATEPFSRSREPLSHMVLEEMRDGVLIAIEALPELERIVMVALYKERRTIPEIAALLGKTDGAVRALHQRAVKRLRLNLVDVAGEM
jgi:RNA polymerase sigma-70 factor (ECF subfamily)